LKGLKRLKELKRLKGLKRLNLPAEGWGVREVEGG
jgi:hypothetical protein